MSLPQAYWNGSQDGGLRLNRGQYQQDGVAMRPSDKKALTQHVFPSDQEKLARVLSQLDARVERHT